MMDGGYNLQKEAEEEEEQEGEVQFFDARDDIPSVSESCPDSPAACRQSRPAMDFLPWCSGEPQFDAWNGKLDSVQERRRRFMAWMRLNFICSPHPESPDLGEVAMGDDGMVDNERIVSSSMAEPRNSGPENGASMSSWFSDASCSSENGWCEENAHWRIKNLDDGTMFVVEQLGQDGMLSSLREVGSNRMVTIDEFHRGLSPSSIVQRFMRREDNMSTSSGETVRRRRMGWLRRLGVATCIVNRQEEDSIITVSDVDQSVRDVVHRIKVRPYKKHSKEFSAVYSGQDIKAHNGAILTMKFSPDGQYLATGGDDGMVRVWHVTACERTFDDDLPKDDPSCVYFTVDQNSELIPICMNKENKSKSKGIRTTPDSACIVIPTEAFRISEKPLHEFCGHTGDVLDLSWSNNNYLLSSSTDKTARLWQVGCDSVVKVFSHSNYVTCVQFNPIDENCFVSGSIDGKVRIWDISGHHVVDWIDARDIVTAVSYNPDGKGVVVGTIVGHCLFYDSSDKHLQLDGEVLLQGKKKSACCRITGFQYCPGDPQKLMVTSADSQVRVLDGVEVICKYKGLQNAGSQISASFTADGRYIISASADSNVYIWNYADEDGARPNHMKSIWSHERFLSENASVAIFWHGVESRNPVPGASQVLESQKEVLRGLTGISGNNLYCQSESLGNSTSYLSSSGSFTLDQSFFSEFLPKGSATWPEEKLPSRSLTAATALCKSHYKLLKTSCHNIATSPHAWGRVIVTAGWDGRIRSFHNYGLPVHT